MLAVSKVHFITVCHTELNEEMAYQSIPKVKGQLNSHSYN